MCDRLFSPGEASDPAYVNLRDLQEEWIIPAREFVESLWGRFREFADLHFLTEVRSNFHARFWEMYLTCALQEYAVQRGTVLSCPKPGPDILLEHEGNRVWIEAVVATNGTLGHPDAVVEPSPDGKIPEEKLVLRYTNAIAEKYRKYRGYFKAGIIQKNDAFVIAINASALGYKFARAERDAPRFLKAIFPIGAYQVLLNRQTREIAGHQNEPRFGIVKAGGATVATMSFLERRSRGISAILASFADAGSHRAALGCDFELAHNPMSRAPIPDFVIPAKTAWRAVLNDNGGELTARTLV
jgi:hypothetical protein